MFKKIAFFLGFLWTLPVSLGFWIFGIVLLVTGQIQKFKMYPDFTFLWDLTNEGWFCRKAFSDRGWGGWSCGNNIVVIDSDTERWERTVKHENRHCQQQYACGLFFYPIYIINSIWIWLFQRSKHSYYDNWFERGARSYAGQKVEIPKEQWSQGMTDRWAWW